MFNFNYFVASSSGNFNQPLKGILIVMPSHSMLGSESHFLEVVAVQYEEGKRASKKLTVEE